MNFWNTLMAGRKGPPAHAPAPNPPQELVLYKYDSCPFCRRVASVVDELGLQVATRDTLTDPGAREELRARTGRSQVPCLFIDDEPLFLSLIHI